MSGRIIIPRCKDKFTSFMGLYASQCPLRSMKIVFSRDYCCSYQDKALDAYMVSLLDGAVGGVVVVSARLLGGK